MRNYTRMVDHKDVPNRIEMLKEWEIRHTVERLDDGSIYITSYRSDNSISEILFALPTKPAELLAMPDHEVMSRY